MPVPSEISDLGFEMHDSSNFKIASATAWSVKCVNALREEGEIRHSAIWATTPKAGLHSDGPTGLILCIYVGMVTVLQPGH